MFFLIEKTFFEEEKENIFRFLPHQKFGYLVREKKKENSIESKLRGRLNRVIIFHRRLTGSCFVVLKKRSWIKFSTRIIGIEKEGSRLRKELPVAWIHRTCAHTHSETWNSRIVEKTRWSNALAIPESKK